MARRKINLRIASGWLAAGLIVGALLGWFMATVIQAMTHRTFVGLNGVYIGTGVFFGALFGFLVGAVASAPGVGFDALREAGWAKVLLLGAVSGPLGAYLGMQAGFLYLQVVPGGDLVWIMFSIMFGVSAALLPALVLGIRAMRRQTAPGK